MAEIAMGLQHTTGAKPSGGRALDFGCGVGRLAEAMTDYADEVTGLDISPGMLALARERGGKAQYVDTLPGGAFDWINSFIVLQHIEPSRGMVILEDLLSQLAPGGFVSLQLTAWFEPRHKPPPRPDGWRGKAYDRHRRKWLAGHGPGISLMYEYDFSAVLRLLNLAGVGDVKLIATDHDGHHGFIILGRKALTSTTA
jgi:SAM-dependent methyltransferase